MPYKSPGNVFNPRAHKYFHPTGSNDVRLTQPPSVFQLPPLPAKTSVIFRFLNAGLIFIFKFLFKFKLSVINLFDLGQRYQNGEPDFYINQYVNSTANKLRLNEESKVDGQKEKTIEIHLDNLEKIDPVAITDSTK
jgi:hypothetical protein